VGSGQKSREQGGGNREKSPLVLAERGRNWQETAVFWSFLTNHVPVTPLFLKGYTAKAFVMSGGGFEGEGVVFIT
jgi:hypothetical protein